MKGESDAEKAHHQGLKISGYKPGLLTDEKQQQQNEVDGDVLHCCGSKTLLSKVIKFSFDCT